MLLTKPTPSENFVRGFIPGQHRGMDWGWQLSRPELSMEILAAADGIVVGVYSGNGFNEGWGRRVEIEHGNGIPIKTTYNHIRPDGILVEVGQRVRSGQLIARMGSSGASTGTHLHFELYINGVRVDPSRYFTTHLPGTEPEQPAGGGSISYPSGPINTKEDNMAARIIVTNKSDPQGPKGMITDNRRMRLITKYENIAYRAAQRNPNAVEYIEMEGKDFRALLAGKD